MLENYKFPEDLKKLNNEELETLSAELREFLIEKVSNTGGHLASNLGVVELTIALHRAFDLPRDKIIWDVGHQAYVHKILSGRVEGFDGLRSLDGLSGFPKRRESDYDSYDTGHSSTAVSAATGFAAARDLAGDDYQIVAVLGDGALTGGEAYEGLNHLGSLQKNVLVVLNDNRMSITENTGAMASHLAKLRMTSGYRNFKESLKRGLVKLPEPIGSPIYAGLERAKNSIKYAVISDAVFEYLGFTYLGPVDGHSIKELEDALALCKRFDGPVLLHVVTTKGKGYKYAENNPSKFHGIGKFDPATGETQPSGPSYSEVFGNKLTALAREREDIVAVSAAMVEGTGLQGFFADFPDRSFDVGIAEQHAVTFAAAMALRGCRPVVAIYSTFLQRAYDQIMIDVCMQGLPVIFAIDRAGCVGEDGETHNGTFDISYLNHLPGMTVLAPKDGRELEAMLDYALTLNGPCAIRYPRGKAADCSSFAPDYGVTKGAELISEGKDCEIWALGKMVEVGHEVCEKLKEKGIDAGLTNARFAKPADAEQLLASAKRAKLLVTLEDNVLTGGFGSAVSDMLKNAGARTEVLSLGWPEKFVEHGNTAALFERYALDAESVAERIEKALEGKA